MMKAFDPRKIIEAFGGNLGGAFGTIFGSFGDYADIKPESHFKLEQYYSANDYFNPDTIIRAAIPDFSLE